MNKVLVICGPTATGKTKLGLELASKHNGEIVSADSRQVYKYLDIGTGKGISNFEFRVSDLSWQHKSLGYYQNNDAKIWGYDLVDPSYDFNVSEYRKFAHIVIKDIWKRNKLPILVGGTGLYLKAVFAQYDTFNIPPNQELRKQIENWNVHQLQNRLKQDNVDKFNIMNHSDQHNPRRLIRAIEVSQSLRLTSADHLGQDINSLWVGLTASKQLMEKNIRGNVIDRAGDQMTQEIEFLKNNGISNSRPAATATGYQLWGEYLAGTKTFQEVINLWVIQEVGYAKRQLTWFKKQPNINWIDTCDSNMMNKVEHLIKSW